MVRSAAVPSLKYPAIVHGLILSVSFTFQDVFKERIMLHSKVQNVTP